MSETKFLSKTGLETLVANLKSYIQTHSSDNAVIVKGDADNSAILNGEYSASGTNYSNKAISQVSTAIGAAVTAGLKGWYYTKVNLSKNLIWLSTDRLVNKLPLIGTVIGLKVETTTATEPSDKNFTCGWKVGDEVTIVNDVKYERCSKITAISGNMITLDKLPFDSSTLVTSAAALGNLNEPDEFSITAIRITDNDTTKTRIVSSYDKGDIDFGGGANAVGVQTYALNIGAHAEGIQTVAYGQYSHAEGFRTEAAYAAHAEGKETKAKGENSHSEGAETQAIGNNSHAEGKETKATNYSSHAEGYGTVAGDKTTSVTINDSPGDGCYTHAEGNGTRASGHSSHSEGKGSISLGNMSHAEGLNTEASGNASHAEGNKTKTFGSSSHSEGITTTAGGIGSHTEGTNTITGKYDSTAEKWIDGNSAHAEGYGTTASANYSHAEGEGTTASGIGSHTEGKNTTAGGRQSHAQGENSHADGNISFASGRNTLASSSMSSTFGDGTIANNISSTAFGSYNISIEKTDKNTTADATFFSIGIGRKNTDNDAATNPDKYRKNAFEIKQNGDIYINGIGNYDGKNIPTNGDVKTVINNIHNKQKTLEKNITTIESNLEQLNDSLENNISQLSGQLDTLNSNMQAIETNLQETDKHLEEQILNNQLSEGSNIQIKDKSINVINTPEFIDITLKDFGSVKNNFLLVKGTGISSVKLYDPTTNNTTNAIGDYSIALGYNTTASGWASHTEGLNTVASGERSHAEGNSTVAAVNDSHAEGHFTYAMNYSAHAEGYGTVAGDSTTEITYNENGSAGGYTHAEGNGTRASGTNAHSEGYRSIAAGKSSHAEGVWTKTTNEGEHAEGKYNNSTTNKTIHSVGIGKSDTDRKNAYEITQDGKHYILGIGNYDGTNPTSSKDLATILSTVDNSDSNNFIVEKNLEVRGDMIFTDITTNTVNVSDSLTIAGNDYRCYPTERVNKNNLTVPISGSTRIIYEVEQMDNSTSSDFNSTIEGTLDIGGTIDIMIMPSSGYASNYNSLYILFKLIDVDTDVYLYVIDPNNYMAKSCWFSNDNKYFKFCIPNVISEEEATTGGELIITRISEYGFIINATNWSGIQIYS